MSMKALVKEKAAPGLWLKEIPVPSVGPNDVLIKIDKTAICGTDVHIFNWNAWAISRSVIWFLERDIWYVGTAATVLRADGTCVIVPVVWG